MLQHISRTKVLVLYFTVSKIICEKLLAAHQVQLKLAEGGLRNVQDVPDLLTGDHGSVGLPHDHQRLVVLESRSYPLNQILLGSF